MRVAVRKVQGVQSVDVSLKAGRVTIALAAGNPLTLDQLRHIIEKAGFTPKEATVTADGALVDDRGHAALRVSGTGETLLLTAPPGDARAYDEAHRRVGAQASVEVDGRVNPPAAGQPQYLAITAMRSPVAPRASVHR